MSNDTLGVPIRWGDPPPRKPFGGSHGKAGRLGRFVAILQSRPGEWAKYPFTTKSSGAGTANAKNYPGTEWTTRKVGKDTYEVYGRWVGITVTAADLEGGDHPDTDDS